jgi:hypothetical protein
MTESTNIKIKRINLNPNVIRKKIDKLEKMLNKQIGKTLAEDYKVYRYTVEKERLIALLKELEAVE